MKIDRTQLGQTDGFPDTDGPSRGNQKKFDALLPHGGDLKRANGAGATDRTALDAAMRREMESLMNKEFPNVPPEYRAAVSTWMTNDPVIREKLLGLVRQGV